MTTLDRKTTRGADAIYVTYSDMRRLLPLVDGEPFPGRKDGCALRKLEEELDRALVVGAEDLPPGVVTLDSRLALRDLDSGAEMTFTLVLPSRANADQGRISVLAPLGTAVLGYRAGDEIEWDVPAGRRRLRLLQVWSPTGVAPHR